MNNKVLMPGLRSLALFSVLLMVFSIPVYAEPFSGTLSISPSTVSVGYSGTYSSTIEPTATPPGGFFIMKAMTIPAGYEFIQPPGGNLIASYTMYNKTTSKNQVIINIYSNNPAVNTVNVQYSLDNGLNYTTVNNLDRANMMIGGTSLQFIEPTPTVDGSIYITHGGATGPVTTDHKITIGLASGVLRSPNTPGSYNWNLEARNSPGGTPYYKSFAVSVVSNNIIKNPGFELGTVSWTFYPNTLGRFTTGPPAFEGTKSANIAIYTGDTNIQLYQTGITLEANTRYRLSFEAFSNTGHDMTVELFKHGAPYTKYMKPAFKADLGNSWQEFSKEFTTTGFTGTVSDARLMFYLIPFAAAGDRYYIDNVRLEKVGATVTGILDVTTTPVSGDIYVNGTKKGTGSWSGSMPVGNYIVSFGHVSGYTTPSPQTVAVNDGVTTIVTGTYLTSTNLISNPGFESGTVPWIFFTNGKGTFNVVLSDNEGLYAAEIALRTVGSNMQLSQSGITLEKGANYRLRFAAKSTTGHDMNVRLLKNDFPFTFYGLNKKFDLTGAWQEFSADFTATGMTTSTVNNGRLMFYLVPFGKAGDKYYIDNVRLEKI